MIDWDVALKTAERMVPPGPPRTAAEVEDVVADLRAAAAEAEGPVREFTGLTSTSPATPVLVVDRTRWVEANLASSRVLLEPILAKLQESHRGTSHRAPTGLAKSVGESINGLEIGALMSFMSTKVLGQFDPFTENGRLLLVAPNIVQAERQLRADPADFRRWVCLHEETHRVQFTAVPWLRDHMRTLIGEFADATELDPAAMGKLLANAVGEIFRILRGASDASLLDLLQNDAQRQVIDKMTGVMSLLEGHADVVMDGVGPEVVPSVASIRRAFERRRQGTGGLDRLLRRLLGLDAKLRQYRDGAGFVRSVVDKAGKDGFDAVWAEPANLPSKAEILAPDTWVRRVHG
jgi:coenzyme F420 biosynthesis associated uncharacterized protein